MNLFYCCNDKIAEGIFLSATSVARRTKSAVNVYILTMDLTDKKPTYIPFSQENALTLRKALKTFNPENTATAVDLTEKFANAFPGGKNLKNSYTPYALLRLLTDDEKAFPFDKAIYLDADTMAYGDLSELWNVNVDGYEYAAALDYMGKFWVAKDYCNSGVLLLNLKKIRETGLFVKCRALLNGKTFFMPDQTALHRSATARLYLDGRFNEQRDVKPDTVIKHFNKGIKWLPFFHLYNIKQWQRDAVRKKLGITAFDEDYAFYDNFMKEKDLQTDG